MRGPWEYEDPSCASVGGEFWYPDNETNGTGSAALNSKSPEIQIAKSICNGCSHKQECGQWGLQHERYGIWGGLGERERFLIRKRLNIIVKEVGVVNLTTCVGDSPHQSNTSS